MMKLAQAASYFDRTPVLDADKGNRLFYGQLDPYDDSRRDAGAAYRRILSVAPGTKMPASLAVQIFGQSWIIGARETDGLAEPIRDKYVVQLADQKYSIYRLPAFLAGSAAASAWGFAEWVKDLKEIEADSRLPQECTLYLPAGTDVRERDVLAYAGAAFLALAPRAASSGFTAVTALRLDQSAPAPATITPRTYAPGVGMSSGVPVTVQALRLRWQSLFEYDSQATERYREGDCSLVLPAATTLTGRDRITFDGAAWQVVSSQAIAGATVAHLRLA